MSYYERDGIVHLDGTRIFRSQQDELNEEEVAFRLADGWRCQVRSFGMLAPVDWYAIRDGRLVGVLELKSRPHPSSRFPTVFLNVRKWLALRLAATGLGVPDLFVVRFEDGIWWTPVSEIDASRIQIAGCTRSVKSRSDVEPVIHVPVAAMRALEQQRAAA